MFVTILFIFSSIAYAQTCEVANVKQVLRNVLYTHFIEPGSNPLSLNEVKDILSFYLSISEGLTAVDCSVLGSKSNKKIFEIISLGGNLSNKIAACSDGTQYGECSTFKPKYCYAGSLVHRCDYCGCPSPSGCSTDGKCVTQTENLTVANETVNCYVKIDGNVIKSVLATDRLDCYNKTSFGSQNCQVYTPYFKEGSNFLEQYFGATDRVNNEYCTCQNGVCTQGNMTQNQTNLQPDLTVADITFTPSSPKTTDYIQINITIKNIGALSAGEATIKLDYPGGYWRSNIPSLEPGKSYDFINLGNGPFPAGTQTFTALIDEYNWVLEQNEDNNILTKSLVVANETNQTAVNLSVSLHSLAVNTAYLEVNYSKNFDTCVHLVTQNFKLTHTLNYFCTKGDYIKMSPSISDFNVTVGQSYKLCHGNNYNICSGLKTLLNVTPASTSQTNTTSSTQCTSKLIDFEDDPSVGGSITWNPDYGAEPQDVKDHRAWLNSKGIDITGTPNGFVWSTRISGPAGETGVVVGFASPNYNDDDGLSDNEVLTISLLNNVLVKSAEIGLTTIPATVNSVNNVPSTVIIEAFNSAGSLVSSSTKTFTGVTNNIYTPTKINVSSAASDIAKISLKTTQHPVEGVYTEDVSIC